MVWKNDLLSDHISTLFPEVHRIKVLSSYSFFWSRLGCSPDSFKVFSCVFLNTFSNAQATAGTHCKNHFEIHFEISPWGYFNGSNPGVFRSHFSAYFQLWNQNWITTLTGQRKKLLKWQTKLICSPWEEIFSSQRPGKEHFPSCSKLRSIKQSVSRLGQKNKFGKSGSHKKQFPPRTSSSFCQSLTSVGQIDDPIFYEKLESGDFHLSALIFNKFWDHIFSVHCTWNIRCI